MRWQLLVVLAVTVGCNQIFGIKPTVEVNADGAPVETLPPQFTYLQWGIPKSDGTVELDNIGSEQLRPQTPTIQVGAQGSSQLVDALYDVSTGAFMVPDTLLGHPWRMVYKLPDDAAPTEIEWTVSTVNLVIPRLTRLNAGGVPPGSGYKVAPVPAPTLSVPFVITSGVYGFSLVAGAGTGEFDFTYAGSMSQLTGPIGAPDKSQNDWLLAMNWNVGGGRQTGATNEESCDGWAMTTVADLMPNQLSPTIAPPWHTGSPTRVQITPPDPVPQNRLLAALGPLANATATYGYEYDYGLTPTTQLPGFTADGRPIILPLDLLPANLTQSYLTLVDVDSSVPGVHVVYVQVSNARTPLGTSVQLTSSVEEVAGAAVQQQPVALAFPASLSRTETFGPDGGAMQDLSSNDGNKVTANAGPMRLTFTLEGGAQIGADDIQVLLYELAGSSLTLQRTYQLPGNATFALIDGSLLQKNHTYVFAIRTRKGYPNATAGDYRTVSYPFGQSTKFSGTFAVQ